MNESPVFCHCSLPHTQAEEKIAQANAQGLYFPAQYGAVKDIIITNCFYQAFDASLPSPPFAPDPTRGPW